MLVQLLSVLFVLTAFGQQEKPPVAAKDGYRVSGIVVDAMSGEPLADADVSLSSNNTDGPQTTRTGEDGRFAFENVAAGKHVLHARHRGYVEQNYQQHEGYTTGIVTGPGLEADNLRFTLAPMATISGQISDEQGDGVRNAQVLLIHQRVFRGRKVTQVRQRRTTDDTGRYQFSHLEPGSYVVAVSARPWYAMNVPKQDVQVEGQETRTVPNLQYEAALDVVYPVTYFPNATDLSAASPITLHAGDRTTADIALLPAPALHLLVSAPKGDAPQNSFAQVSQPMPGGGEENLPVSATYSGTRVIELSGLPPGRLNVRMTETRDNEQSVRSQTVEISGDMQMDASEMKALGVVGGKVLLDDGSPLTRGANVMLQNTKTEERVAVQTDANGEFTFKDNRIGPGTYEIMVFEEAGTVLRELSATGAKVIGHDLEITGGQDVHVTVVETKASGRINGFAQKGDKPVSGVLVVLVPDDPETKQAAIRMDQSDSDGSFALGAIPPGDYTLLALEKGWDEDWANPSVLKKYVPHGERVHMDLSRRMDLKVQVQ